MVQSKHGPQTETGHVEKWEGERGENSAKRPGVLEPRVVAKRQRDQETSVAKIAGLHKEKKLGEGAQPNPWAAEFRVEGGICQLG